MLWSFSFEFKYEMLRMWLIRFLAGATIVAATVGQIISLLSSNQECDWFFSWRGNCSCNHGGENRFSSLIQYKNVFEIYDVLFDYQYFENFEIFIIIWHCSYVFEYLGRAIFFWVLIVFVVRGGTRGGQQGLPPPTFKKLQIFIKKFFLHFGPP